MGEIDRGATAGRVTALRISASSITLSSLKPSPWPGAGQNRHSPRCCGADRMRRKPRDAGRSLGNVEIELVHALVVEPQHSLRAVHLDLEPVLAAMGHAARAEHRARRSRNRTSAWAMSSFSTRALAAPPGTGRWRAPHRPWRVRACRSRPPAHGPATPDDTVRSPSVPRPASLARRRHDQGEIGIGHVVLIDAAAEIEHLADRALGDQRAWHTAAPDCGDSRSPAL